MAETIKCSQCGYENDGAATACAECGAEVKKRKEIKLPAGAPKAGSGSWTNRWASLGTTSNNNIKQ